VVWVCRITLRPCSSAYWMAASRVGKAETNRKTRSRVPEPRPLRTETEAAYRPVSVSLLIGDRVYLPMESACAEREFTEADARAQADEATPWKRGCGWGTNLTCGTASHRGAVMRGMSGGVSALCEGVRPV